MTWLVKLKLSPHTAGCKGGLIDGEDELELEGKIAMLTELLGLSDGPKFTGPEALAFIEGEEFLSTEKLGVGDDMIVMTGE